MWSVAQAQRQRTLCSNSPGLWLSCLPLKQQAITWPSPVLQTASVTDMVNFVFLPFFYLTFERDVKLFGQLSDLRVAADL